MTEHGKASAPVPAILRYLRAIEGVVRRGEIVLLVTVLITMIGLAFAQVLLRKLRPHFPSIQEIPWFDILNRHLVLWVAILGASISAREGRHFGVEILPKLFSERGRRRLEALLNLTAGVVSTLITVTMYQYVLLSQRQVLFVVDAIQIANVTEAGTHGLAVDRRWLIAIMPVGLALMTARFFLRSLEAALLTDDQWHAFERELKPEVTAAEPVAEVAAAPVAPVAPAASTSAAPVAPAAPSPDAPSAPTSPAPAAPPATGEVPRSQRKHTATDEIRVRRVGDLGDVEDPEERPGVAASPDPEEMLVDSDVIMADAREVTGDDEASSAPTERAPKAGAPPAPADRKPTEEPPSPGAVSGEKRS